MADVKINFMHPTDGHLLTLTIDKTKTVQEAVADLFANGFVKPNSKGYNLAIKGGRELQENESFEDANVKDNDTIRVIPPTDAGGGYMISTLGYLPYENNMNFYIFLVGSNWIGNNAEIILRNFENIARQIGPDASIVRGLEEPFWSNEIIKKYFGDGNLQLYSCLPALLITDSHPDNLNEDNLRLFIPISDINKNFQDFEGFFNQLIRFVRFHDTTFLDKFIDKTNILDNLLDIIDLNPNFWGIGINLNNFIKKFIKTNINKKFKIFKKKFTILSENEN